MKRFLLTLVIAIASGFSYSQVEVYLFTAEGTNIDGDTLKEVINPSIFDKAVYVKVKNVGANTVKLKVRTTEVNVMAATSNTTCWVDCPLYSTAGDNPVRVSSQSVNLTQNQTEDSFVGHFRPQNVSGTSLFKYEWININNNDEVLSTIYVLFDHQQGNGIVDLSKTASVNIFPIPADKEFNLKLHGVEGATKIQVDVYDLLGQRVNSKQMSSSLVRFNTESFKNGIYLVSVLIDGKVLTTQKLVVRH